jgi:hypothetical protein
VIDRDIDFRNEYAYYKLAGQELPVTATGLTPNKYAIGPSLLWLPFFLAAHGIALLGQLMGIRIAADGYGYLYQAAISIGSIVYGSLGFLMAYRVARRWCSLPAAISAVGLLWLASNTFYYMVFEPSMPHMVSLFSVAFLFAIWEKYFRFAEPPAVRYALFLGVACGLVALVRLQDSVVLLVPIGTLIYRLVRSVQQKHTGLMRRWLVAGGISGIAAFVTFAPQLVVWQTLYGTWSVSPYLNDHNPPFYWHTPQIFNVLFSSFHGLLSWHPIYLVALLGLPMLYRYDRSVTLAMALTIGLQVYLVAAWWAWWQGDSLGGRMFLSLTVIWVVGVAAVLDWLYQHRQFRIAIVIGIVLIAWNGLALIQYRLGYVPMGEPLTWQQMTIERIKLPWTILRTILTR